MLTRIPSQGQLVDVRQRRYVVLDVKKSSLDYRDPLGGGSLAFTGQQAHHLVTLASVEDDATGEELQVVWELEPGAQAHHRLGLPGPASATGYDEPRRLTAFLNAVRWGAVVAADSNALQAPFRCGFRAEEYQLDPVARALRMPRANLLIADDVGVGKTIEAGLVVQELLLRQRARTVLVVCPADIQIQWRDEMRDKFGLEFRIVDSEMMRKLRRQRGLHVNPWTHFPRLITSIDFLKRDRPLRLMREALPPAGEPAFPRKFDLLIVDEAHNVAPSGSGHYALESARTRTIRELTPHFEHKLFLTATPHNGYKESFTSLLELLDNQRFARGVEPDRRQLEAVMVRRLKSELRSEWEDKERFATRRLEPLEVAYTPAERRAHQALREYTQLRRAGANGDGEKYATEFVLKLLKKRLFSSPQAFATTLGKHRQTLEEPPSSRAMPKVGTNLLRQQIEGIEEQQAHDEEFEEALDGTVNEATRLFHAPTAAERALLGEMQTYAADAAARGDSKADALVAWLKANIKPNGQWGDRRVIIFTEYRATQKWLHDRFAAAGLAGSGRLQTIYGGMSSDERERIKAAFQADPSQSEVRILLATDAASEGVNLQNHCSHLFHYEIPWNPNRMEQRNGRIDRHGQRSSEVWIYHFVGKGFEKNKMVPTFHGAGDLEGDLEFLMRAALKVENIREDLGKVGPVIAWQVEEAMLGQRTRLDTARAEDEAAPVRRMLKFERDLKRQLAALYEQLQSSRIELRLEPENVQNAVEIALELAGQPPLRPATAPGIWPDVSGLRQSCPVFHLPLLTGSWQACADGLLHPHTKQVRPIVFDADLADKRDDVVLAHLNHRLVQMALRLLRSAMEAGGEHAGLQRVAAVLVPSSALELPAVIAHGRIVVLGGDNQRLHEEVIAAGGIIRQSQLTSANRLNVGDLKNALAAATDVEASPAVKARMAELWPNLERPLLQALEQRMRDRTANLQKLLDDRAMEECDSITAILRELEKAIRAELAGQEPQQLTLWTDTERDQLRRNRDVLRARVERIPAEIERETEAILKRYTEPKPRLFPAAVTFLVPERIAREIEREAR